MSNYAKQLEEKRQRAAARRADLGFNENAPPSTTSWIAGLAAARTNRMRRVVVAGGTRQRLVGAGGRRRGRGGARGCGASISFESERPVTATG